MFCCPRSCAGDCVGRPMTGVQRCRNSVPDATLWTGVRMAMSGAQEHCRDLPISVSDQTCSPYIRWSRSPRTDCPAIHLHAITIVPVPYMSLLRLLSVCGCLAYISLRTLRITGCKWKTAADSQQRLCRLFTRFFYTFLRVLLFVCKTGAGNRQTHRIFY